MVAFSRTTAVLLSLSAAAALKFAEKSHPGKTWVLEGDHILDNSHRDAKPGSAAVPDKYQDTQPNMFSLWQRSLGDRLIRAASAGDAIQSCGSFLSFGDFSWCKKAMPLEANPALKPGFRMVHEYTIDEDVDLTGAPPGDEFLALSFGVEESDCWSELMSSLYYVKAEIFDCYYNGTKGPLVNDWRGNHSMANPCMERHCYTEEYRTNRICLDDSSDQPAFADKDSRQFQSVFKLLEGRPPLSTFVKIDIEGSEWGALERLLDNEEELAKIRTLDMEVHFNMQPHVVDRESASRVRFANPPPTQDELTHHVELMERLAQKFAVTGSTLEHKMDYAGLKGEFARDRGNVFLVTTAGYDIDQYAISFVNRALL